MLPRMQNPETMVCVVLYAGRYGLSVGLLSVDCGHWPYCGAHIAPKRQNVHLSSADDYKN